MIKISKRKLVTLTLGVVTLGVAAPAFAILPGIFLLQSLGLHLIAGLALAFIKTDIRDTPTSAPTTVVWDLIDDDDRDGSEVSATQPVGVQLPASIQRTSSGGVAQVTVAALTYDKVQYPEFTVSAPPNEFPKALSKALLEKSNPATWAGYLTGLQPYTAEVMQHFGDMSQLYAVLTPGNSPPTQIYQKHYMSVVYRSGPSASILRFIVEGAQLSPCPSGYVPNPNSEGYCIIKDPDEARKDPTVARDGKCVVSKNGPNPFDPDCAALMGKGQLAKEVDTGGTPTYVLRGPDGDVTAMKPKEDGSKEISKSQRNPDGSGGLQVATVSPEGKVGEVTGVNYPANKPPPEYPGQGTGGGNGTGGTGGTGGNNGGSSTVGSECGTKDKPCSVKLEIGDPVSDTPTGSTMPSAFEGLANKSLPVSAQCPANIFSFTMPLPDTVGGPLYVTDKGAFCDAMSSYQDLIRMVSIAAAWIMAMFIVLRA